MKNVYLSILAATVIEFISVFLPIKETGALKKYVNYILSLVVVLTVVTPVLGIFAKGEFPEVFKNSGDVIAQIPELDYVYIDKSGVYAADSNGSKTGENTVICDMYVRETCLQIADNVKEALHEKFGISSERLKVAVGCDLRDLENIRLVRAFIYTENLPEIVKNDLYEYTKELIGTEVTVS